jgi:hypothetical protein
MQEQKGNIISHAQGMATPSAAITACLIGCASASVAAR